MLLASSSHLVSGQLLWLSHGGLRLLKTVSSLQKSFLLLLFLKPTSLAASTGAASDFHSGIYSCIDGWASGNPGIP